MGDGTQALLGDELTCLSADAVGLILDATQCRLEVVDELQKSLGHTTSFSLGEGSSAFMDSFKGRLGVGYIVACTVCSAFSQEVIIANSLVELVQDQVTELL